MARAQLQPKAEDDVAEIWAYIADDSEAQADAFIDELNAQFQLLAQRPAIGSPRGELSPLLRGFPFGRYAIYYQPVARGISVVRVLHSARDTAALLKPPK